MAEVSENVKLEQSRAVGKLDLLSSGEPKERTAGHWTHRDPPPPRPPAPAVISQYVAAAKGFFSPITLQTKPRPTVFSKHSGLDPRTHKLGFVNNPTRLRSALLHCAPMKDGGDVWRQEHIVGSTSKLLLQRHVCGSPRHPGSPTAVSQSVPGREETGDNTCLGSSSHSGHSCSCPR
ncbi:unnamed protein product [Arctogadus glacialis]